ncbi:MAG TPA: phosphatidylglycerol lysyltransferase domain-containing protein [Bacillota bacterium]|nr:phosphatidylglycerol lysyltransferase domain-containing protein [Bacillota bacterium]
MIKKRSRWTLCVDAAKSKTAPWIFFFVSLFLWAKEHGYEGFNLSLSPLAGVGHNESDPAVERALYYIYQHMNQFYNFQGLHRYKEKFHPQWSPRHLIYPGSVNLPNVAVALVRADSGDSFIREFIQTIFHREH